MLQTKWIFGDKWVDLLRMKGNIYWFKAHFKKQTFKYQDFQVKRLKSKWNHESLVLKSKSRLKSSNQVMWLESTRLVNTLCNPTSKILNYPFKDYQHQVVHSCWPLRFLTSKLWKQRVGLRPCRKCLYSGFWSIIAQNIPTICPLTPLTSCLFFLFLMRSSAKQTPRRDAYFHETPLCPFWTSCNTLSEQCQSRWWQRKIGVPSDAAGENRKCHTYIYMAIIAAVGLELCHLIALQ